MTCRCEVSDKELHAAWFAVSLNQSGMETVFQVVHDFIVAVGMKKSFLIWKWFGMFPKMCANTFDGIDVDKCDKSAIVRVFLNT